MSYPSHTAISQDGTVVQRNIIKSTAPRVPTSKKDLPGKNLWARGCLAVTSGTITDEMVQDYIKSQEGETVEEESRFLIDKVF